MFRVDVNFFLILGPYSVFTNFLSSLYPCIPLTRRNIHETVKSNKKYITIFNAIFSLRGNELIGIRAKG